jgi:hypothetical protein
MYFRQHPVSYLLADDRAARPARGLRIAISLGPTTIATRR